MAKRIVSLIGMIVVALFASGCAGIARADDGPQGNQFVKRAGGELRLNGKVFRFAGTNNYYLMYKSPEMVDDVLEAAAKNNFRVVRTWGWLDIGNQDGSNSVRGKADGVYFQYWDGTKPAYNDGADGLQRLDYIINKARQAGLRLVIPFTNNWADFGGMDQYVKWRGGRYHDEFYTDPVIRQWYKDWIAHLLNRTNTLNGIKYKDDPTIMTWELANEPRCKGSGKDYPTSASCTTQTLTAWADEMSTFIKSIDDKHLVSVGDEGFYCVPNAQDWIDNCGEGVDTLAFTRLENIDVMSMHLYPDHWGKDAAWGTTWIKWHIQDARKLNKPVMLGEFGLLNKNTRNAVYQEWTDTVFKDGGNSALYWILSGKQDDASLYPDYDGFTVYQGTPVFSTLGHFAEMMTANRALSFAPVADHDTVLTDFGKPLAIDATANDVTYGGKILNAATLDLDVGTAGVQSTASVASGTFTRQADGKLNFTPAEDFIGEVELDYTVQDSAGRSSNVATVTVTVKPKPGAAVTLFSFESGTEGWASASWEPGRATASQSTQYATEGAYSLEVNVTQGGWFGVTISPAADLSSKSHVKFDIKAGSSMSIKVALQTGTSWQWREYVPPTVSGSDTVDIDLLGGGGQPGDFQQVQTMYLYLQPGIHYIDNVRAE